ncbi:ead/Ea22-like family protein [Enterobacter hormaechei]|uniref:ead/Ea22-like family protein n=1 Tax=Enterobacter hormaechei TaxID=158836 RepID=UPI00123B82B8|nr:ead/Ea22-like family protein [Enterobacter hormaechei]
MSNIDKQTLREAAEKAKDNFMPNFMVPTRDLLALLDELEAAESRIAELKAREVSIPDYTELYKGPFAVEVEHQVKRALAAAGIRIAAAAGKGE